MQLAKLSLHAHLHTYAVAMQHGTQQHHAVGRVDTPT